MIVKSRTKLIINANPQCDRRRSTRLEARFSLLNPLHSAPWSIAWHGDQGDYLLPTPNMCTRWRNKYKLCFSTFHNLWLKIPDERDKKCSQYFIWFVFIVMYILWDLGMWCEQRGERRRGKEGVISGRPIWSFTRWSGARRTGAIWSWRRRSERTEKFIHFDINLLILWS